MAPSVSDLLFRNKNMQVCEGLDDGDLEYLKYASGFAHAKLPQMLPHWTAVNLKISLDESYIILVLCANIERKFLAATTN